MGFPSLREVELDDTYSSIRGCTFQVIESENLSLFDSLRKYLGPVRINDFFDDEGCMFRSLFLSCVQINPSQRSGEK